MNGARAESHEPMMAAFALPGARGRQRPAARLVCAVALRLPNCTVTESVRAGIPVNVMVKPVRLEAEAAVAHV